MIDYIVGVVSILFVVSTHMRLKKVERTIFKKRHISFKTASERNWEKTKP